MGNHNALLRNVNFRFLHRPGGRDGKDHLFIPETGQAGIFGKTKAFQQPARRGIRRLRLCNDPGQLHVQQPMSHDTFRRFAGQSPAPRARMELVGQFNILPVLVRSKFDQPDGLSPWSGTDQPCP